MKRSAILTCIFLFIVSFFTGCAFYRGGILSSNHGNSSYKESISSSFQISSQEWEGDSSEGFSGENGEENGDSSESTGGGEVNQYTYVDFTAAEKKLFFDLFGETIPFIANNEYYVEEVDYEGEKGIEFYTYGNTRAEFEGYLFAYKAYALTDSYVDEAYGDLWYRYEKGEYCVEVSFYNLAGVDCVDVYAYLLQIQSGGGNEGEESGAQEDEVITNQGKGIPAGSNGVYQADFKSATRVKDVTEQGYYLGGCPTTGASGVLVIPVEFSDVTAKSKGYTTAVLKNAFMKDGKTDYYSVYDYYKTSSYGQLTLNVTVLDFWFKPKYNSAYYQKATMNYYGEQIAIGDQMIMDEALAYLSASMDLSSFDSDNNGIIDSVVLINTLDVGNDDFHWAYRYWNIYTDNNGAYFDYDGVYANDYLWASYQFLYMGYDYWGNVNYSDKNAVNTYTYIHEFGHILGADDYYDTAGRNEPMGGYDVMDYMVGDHNAFTKFHYGWLTTSRLVTTDTSVTLTLEDFEKSGDTILIANNFDPTLGAYQEYYLLTYYRSTGLNSGAGGYFPEEGVVVYHVNASLYKTVEGKEVYYDLYNNNTHFADEYGSENNLIEYVLTGQRGYTFGVGDKLPTVIDDNGDKLAYTFTVDALTENGATITFTKTAYVG